VAGGVTLAATLGIAVPLLAVDGLTGFGAGLCAATVISVGLRLWYLRRLFPRLQLARHVLGGVGPTLPAVAALLVFRAAVPGSDGAGRALGEAAGYALIVGVVTVVSQRALLRESIGYLLSRGASAESDHGAGGGPTASAAPEPPLVLDPASALPVVPAATEP
jgi:hypothetical protein